MIGLETRSPEETFGVGFLLGGLLQSGDVITLNGGLGAGKTCFTGGVAKGLGIQERITSPTFALIHEYDGGRLPFYHLDVYRLGDSAELVDLGYEEYFYSDGVSIVEWADKIANMIPEGSVIIRMSYGCGESERVYEIENSGI